MRCTSHSERTRASTSRISEEGMRSSSWAIPIEEFCGRLDCVVETKTQRLQPATGILSCAGSPHGTLARHRHRVYPTTMNVLLSLLALMTPSACFSIGAPKPVLRSQMVNSAAASVLMSGGPVPNEYTPLKSLWER